jgi:hypothetical protein
MANTATLARIVRRSQRRQQISTHPMVVDGVGQVVNNGANRR